MQKYSARYVVLKKLGDRLAGVDLQADGLAASGEPRGNVRVVETNHYEYLRVQPNGTVAFEIWSPAGPGPRRWSYVPNGASVRRRHSGRWRSTASQRPSRTASCLGIPGPTFDATCRNRAGSNTVRLESAAQLEIVRAAAYSLTRADLPSTWRVAHEDGWYVVLDTRGESR